MYCNKSGIPLSSRFFNSSLTASGNGEKPLIIKFLWLSALVIPLLLFGQARASGLTVPPRHKNHHSALDRYRENLARPLFAPISVLTQGVESRIRNGSAGTFFPVWTGVRVQDLPAPLDKRALFLQAWFRSPDLPLTRKGLQPALTAFPDLAPVLLWHLAHARGIPRNRRAFLARFSSQAENGIFNPSDRSFQSGERARSLWRRYLSMAGTRGENSGDPEGQALLRRLIADHPLSPESSLALLALGKKQVDGSVLIPRWDYLQRMGANDLVVRETRAYLSTRPIFPYVDRALYLEARSLAILGHKNRAMAIVDQSLGETSHGNSERKKALVGPLIRSELSALRCRILLSDELDRGARCIDRLRHRYPDANFLQSLTVSVLRQDLVHPLPSIDGAWTLPDSLWDNKEARNATWLLGLDYAMRGDPARALSIWKNLSLWLSSRPGTASDLEFRLLYFMGRVEERMGHPSRARTLYGQVVSRGSETPYALWAAISCRGNCDSFRLTPHHPTIERTLPPSLRQSMRDLIQMGLFGPALVLERFYRHPFMDREQILRYGDLNIGVQPRFRLELVDNAFLARRTRFKLPTGEWLSPSVISGFRHAGVSTLWALAIARQESRFHERSLSVDGALGVMQLMPRTALTVAKAQSPALERSLVRNLGVVRHPAVNSLIGGLYLKRLIDSVPGQPERAIAGYNAGLHAVLSWKTLAHADWDFFTESIPYQETRRYVREVLWNYAYLDRRLKGKSL